MNDFTNILRQKINLAPAQAAVFGLFAFLGRFPFALAVGGTANYYAYLISRFLLHIPRGATIRPMFEGAAETLIVVAAFIIGMPLAIGEIHRSTRDRRLLGLALGLIGLILCLSPWYVSKQFWDYYTIQRGIQFEQ